MLTMGKGMRIRLVWRERFSTASRKTVPFAHDDGIAKEFEFLAVESHLVFLGEAQLL